MKRKELEDVSRITGRKYALAYGNYNWRSHRKSDIHRVGDYYPYDIAERVAKKYTGKKFDDAFSYYCTLVPKYQQRVFLEFFEFKRYRRYTFYYINSQGIICYKGPERRKVYPYVIKSPDYTSIEVHKITGHKKSDFTPVYEDKRYRHLVKYYKYESKKTSFWFEKKIPLKDRYIAKEEDFIERPLTGWKRVFYSKNDPYFKKYRTLANTLWKKKRAEEAKIKEEKLQEALRRREEQLKLEQLQNQIKIIKHGFDPITSFRK